MTTQNLTAAFWVDQSSKQVFDAINNVRGWWSAEIEADTDKLGAEFTYRYEDMSPFQTKDQNSSLARRSFERSRFAADAFACRLPAVVVLAR